MDGYGFSSYTKKRKQEMLDFYKAYFKDEPPVNVFKNFALAEIKYQDAAYRATYIIKKRVKGHVVESDAAFFNFSAPEYLADSTALNSASYYFFLNIYILNLYGTKLDKFELAEQYLPEASKKVVLSTIALKSMYSSYFANDSTHASTEDLYTVLKTSKFSDNFVDSLIDRFNRISHHEKDSLH